MNLSAKMFKPITRLLVPLFFILSIRTSPAFKRNGYTILKETDVVATVDQILNSIDKKTIKDIKSRFNIALMDNSSLNMSILNNISEEIRNEIFIYLKKEVYDHTQMYKIKPDEIDSFVNNIEILRIYGDNMIGILLVSYRDIQGIDKNEFDEFNEKLRLSHQNWKLANKSISHSGHGGTDDKIFVNEMKVCKKQEKLQNIVLFNKSIKLILSGFEEEDINMVERIIRVTLMNAQQEIIYQCIDNNIKLELYPIVELASVIEKHFCLLVSPAECVFKTINRDNAEISEENPLKRMDRSDLEVKMEVDSNGELLYWLFFVV